MDLLATAYNQRLRQIVLDYQKTSGSDFAVVLEPGFENTEIRQWPVEMLSTLDCFHPSVLAHELMAEMLWNNLQRELKDKTTRVEPGMPKGVLCPTEDSRVWTG
jgi:phospholipase B1